MVQDEVLRRAERDASRRSTPTPDDIRARASDAAFGRPLIVNNLRALVVEMIVASALEPSWAWRAGNWAGWYFEHEDEARLEVKQSAARQTWEASAKGRTAPRFDIKPRTGHYKGAEWNTSGGKVRQAHLYVLAYHGIEDDTADHRDSLQWSFYVVPAERLPASASIALSSDQCRRQD
jgi:hypothetical protein